MLVATVKVYLDNSSEMTKEMFQRQVVDVVVRVAELSAVVENVDSEITEEG